MDWCKILRDLRAEYRRRHPHFNPCFGNEGKTGLVEECACYTNYKLVEFDRMLVETAFGMRFHGPFHGPFNNWDRDEMRAFDERTTAMLDASAVASERAAFEYDVVDVAVTGIGLEKVLRHEKVEHAVRTGWRVVQIFERPSAQATITHVYDVLIEKGRG